MEGVKMAKTIFGIDLKEFKRFNRGKEGVVYRGPDNMLLKVYANSSRCISEYKLLKKLEDSPYFPKVYKCRGIYMLREYVKGTPLVDYINENGLSKKLANNLIDLSEFFYNAKYLRVDGIDKHVFVCEGEKLMVIDPRSKKYRFHRSLLRVLKRLNQEEVFLTELAKNRPELVSLWYEKENIDLDKYKKKTSKMIDQTIDETAGKTADKAKDITIDKKINEENKIEDKTEDETENKPITGFFEKLRNIFK